MLIALCCISALFSFMLVFMFTWLWSKLSGTYTSEFFKYFIYAGDTVFFIFAISIYDSFIKCFSPRDSCTDFIKFSVTSKFGDLLPSHPFCHIFVLSRRLSASEN